MDTEIGVVAVDDTGQVAADTEPVEVVGNIVAERIVVAAVDSRDTVVRMGPEWAHNRILQSFKQRIYKAERYAYEAAPETKVAADS